MKKETQDARDIIGYYKTTMVILAGKATNFLYAGYKRTKKYPDVINVKATEVKKPTLQIEDRK